MFDINKIRPKSVLSPVKAQKFPWCLYASVSRLRHQVFICTGDELLVVGALGTNFSEIQDKIQSQIQSFSLKKMNLITLSAKCQPFCSGIRVMIGSGWPWLVLSLGV